MLQCYLPTSELWRIMYLTELGLSVIIRPVSKKVMLTSMSENWSKTYWEEGHLQPSAISAKDMNKCRDIHHGTKDSHIIHMTQNTNCSSRNLMYELQSVLFEIHEKCPANNDGKKSNKTNFKIQPLSWWTVEQSSYGYIFFWIDFDFCHEYETVFTNDCNGYSCLYWMKNKVEILKVLQTWYRHITVLRTHHTLLTLVRENAGDKKYHKLNECFK